MNKRIAIIGSVNVDTTLYVSSFPKEGETIASKSVKTSLGGKGFNQAVAAKRAGVDVTFFGSLGNDQNAEFIRQGAKECGLDCVFDTYGEVTGSAYIVVNEKSQNEIIIASGSNGNPNPSFLDAVEDYDIIVLQNEIPSLVNAEIIRRYGDKKTILYNPAPARDLDVGLLGNIEYLVPNEVELSNISNEQCFEKAVERILSLGAKNLLVTLGEKGCLLVNKNGRLASSAFSVNAVDTVAAGDTFIGYFSAGLAKGLSIEENLQRANAASGIAVTRKGAVPSIPLKEEVDNFLITH